MTNPIATAGEAITDVASAIEAAEKIADGMYADPNIHAFFRTAGRVIAAAIRQLHDRVAVADTAVTSAHYAKMAGVVDQIHQMAVLTLEVHPDHFATIQRSIVEIDRLALFVMTGEYLQPDPAVEVDALARELPPGIVALCEYPYSSDDMLLHNAPGFEFTVGDLRVLLAAALTPKADSPNEAPVPMEPTAEMLAAAAGWREYDIADHWHESLRQPYGIWRAMYAAAPTYPPDPAVEVDVRELYELVRPIWHYTKRGTGDGAMFEASEHGQMLMRSMKKITAALSRPDDLRTVVTAFLAKWDQVEPAINNAFALQQIHGMPYSGPTIEAELRALRALSRAVDK